MIIQDVTEIEKFIASIDPEKRSTTVANINFIIMNHLSKQKNLNIYSFMDKFITLLSPENQEMLEIYVDDLVKEFNQMHLEETYDKNPSANKDLSISFKNTENKSIDSSNNSKDENSNDASKEQTFDFVPAQDFLDGITPFITDKAKEDVGNLVIDPQTYSVLRNFNGENSVYNIYLKNYSEKSFEDYLIDVLIPFHVKRYISFNKNDKFLDKASRLRIGEILMSFNVVDSYNLDIIIKKQKELTNPKKKSKSLSSSMYDITELEIPENEEQSSKKLIGEILVESECITREILNRFLVIQKWYNHMVSSDI